MTVSMVIQRNISLGGQTFAESRTKAVGAAEVRPVTANAAKAGTLGTRTDDDTGVANLSSGHGLITSDTVDVYWDGGSRRGMTCTVAANAITIDGGDGDNLPVVTTAVMLCKRVGKAMEFAGDGAEALVVASANTRAIVTFADAADAELAAVEVEAGHVWSWDNDRLGEANPLAGLAVAKIFVSQEDTTARTVKVGVGLA